MTTCQTIRFIRSNYSFVQGSTSYANWQYIRGLIIMAGRLGTISFEQETILHQEVKELYEKSLDIKKTSH